MMDESDGALGIPVPKSGIFRLLLLTHLLACSWYGIGRLSGEEWGSLASSRI